MNTIDPCSWAPWRTTPRSCPSGKASATTSAVRRWEDGRGSGSRTTRRRSGALLDGGSTSRGTPTSPTCGSTARPRGRAGSLAMRDTDVGFRTIVVGRAGRARGGGRPRAAGGSRSAAATRRRRAIMPVHYLRAEGLDPGGDVELVRFDTDVGKHGDTGASEREALRAVLDGAADAARGRRGVVGRARPRRRGPARDGSHPSGPRPRTRTATSRCSGRSNPGRADAWTAHLRTMDWDGARAPPAPRARGPARVGTRRTSTATGTCSPPSRSRGSRTHGDRTPASRPRRFDAEELDLASGLVFALDVCLSDIEVGEVLEGREHQPVARARAPGPGAAAPATSSSGRARRRGCPLPDPPRGARIADVPRTGRTGGSRPRSGTTGSTRATGSWARSAEVPERADPTTGFSPGGP